MSELSFDADRNLLTLGGERLVFHCHHYNVFLQRSLEDMLGPDAHAMQVDAAAESARRILEREMARADGLEARMEIAAAIFSSNGFGKADLSKLTAQGGVIGLDTSHYAVGWRAKFGPSQTPVCHFATGFWRGALTAACGYAPERVRAVEKRCVAIRGEQCEIELEVR